MLTQAASEVQLWFASVAELDDPALSAAALAVLSEGEQRQAARFKFERDRNTFLASRSLRRHVLSHYAEVAPAEWQFTTNAHGRPQIAHPMAVVPLEFNVSKSGGVIVCAVTRGVAVGVDIESRDRSVPAGAIEAILAPSERAVLQALPPTEQSGRFYAHWTLKEAYLKARGEGLAMPLEGVVFAVADGADPQVSLVSSTAGDAAGWWFSLLSPTTAHVVAICLQRLPGVPPMITTRWISVVEAP